METNKKVVWYTKKEWFNVRPGDVIIEPDSENWPLALDAK